MTRKAILPLTFALVSGLTTASQGRAGIEAVVVSPGDRASYARVEQRCPTFSWAGSPEATAHEILVVHMPEEPAAEAQTALAAAIEKPRIRMRLPGSASTWTPSGAACLADGERYAWLVRSTAGNAEDGRSDWSEALFFRVAPAPSPAEVAGALEVLQRYLLVRGAAPDSGGVQSAESLAAPARRSERTRESTAREAEPIGQAAATLATAITAFRAEQPDTTGNTAGVVGTTNSPQGTGLIAANLDAAGGADLLLEGSAQSLTDTVVTQSGIDRPSAGAESFDIGNSGGGGMTLKIGGLLQAGSGLTSDPVPYNRIGQRQANSMPVNTIATPYSLLVSGFLEVDGDAYFDRSIHLAPRGANRGVYFHGEYPSGGERIESLLWSDSLARFWLTDGVSIAGSLQAGSSNVSAVGYSRIGQSVTSHNLTRQDELLVSGDFEVDGAAYFDGGIWLDGVPELRNIWFGAGGTADFLNWHPSKFRFEFSDDLALQGALQAGGLSHAAVPYNRMGPGVTTHGLALPTDLFVSNDLEVDGSTFLDGDLSVSNDLEVGGSTLLDGPVGYGCGTYLLADSCPLGDAEGPKCDAVPVGSFCEGDGERGTSNSRDNCGTADWYFRKR